MSTLRQCLGVYKVAADGTIFDVRYRVRQHAQRVALATTVSLGTPADAERIGFFLIQDGFGTFGNLPDNLAFLTPGTWQPANLNTGVPARPGERARSGALTATARSSTPSQTLNPVGRQSRSCPASRPAATTC